MYIDEDHRHYGSALIQVAEDPHFTAINAYIHNGHPSRCGFRVNKNIGLYLRYRSKPKGKKVSVYRFSFSQENLDELKGMRKRYSKLFVALICVKHRHICCLPYADLDRFVNQRRQAKGEDELEYVIEVFLPRGQQFRVWISPPGEKGKYLAQSIVPRNDFPNRLFADSRRSNLNFTEMGIPIGETLQYSHGPVTVTVASAKEVKLGDDELSLTAATRQVMGLDYDVAPAPHWTYKGRSVSEIYDDTYGA